MDQSADNLDELLMVVTAGKLRMSDQERLTAIDRIFEATQDKLQFLRYFNGQGLMLDKQRDREGSEIGSVRKIYGIKSGEER